MELNYEFMADTFFKLFHALPVTLSITFVALLAATPIAFLLALARIKKIKYLQLPIKLYISLVRGVPMIVQILVIYSLLPSLLNYLFKELNISYNIFDLNTIWYAYIIFTLSTCAMLTEVFRSALQSIDQGQLEAGYSVGMSTWRIYLRIIIPQALVVALPSLCNITVSIIKNTSLVFMMAVKDITAVGKIAASYGYNYIEAYIDVFVVYIVICSVVQILFNVLEKSFGSFRQRVLSN